MAWAWAGALALGGASVAAAAYAVGLDSLTSASSEIDYRDLGPVVRPAEEREWRALQTAERGGWLRRLTIAPIARHGNSRPGITGSRRLRCARSRSVGQAPLSPEVCRLGRRTRDARLTVTAA